MALFDLKVMNSVLSELEEERGIPKAKVLEAIEAALATAYKKEYGKKGQIIRADFDPESGSIEFSQIKIVVDETTVREPTENEDAEASESDETEEEERAIYNPEHHIFLEEARKIKKDAELDEEIIFPLEQRDDYGRIAAQTAKQVIIQKIREAEKVSVVSEFGEKEGEIVSGTVQRIERGIVYVDLGRGVGILSYDDQIPGERFRQGERIRALLYHVEESNRGVFLRLSRSHPDFLKELFRAESPEISTETVDIVAISREPGSRSKVAVFSHDPAIDPVGSLVGQRGVRVSTVMSELGGEKIDIIEWSDDHEKFIEDALSPASILSVDIDEEEGVARVAVAPDQQSLAIGKGGQNVRLAARLTGWKIEIQSTEDGEEIEVADPTDDIQESTETGEDDEGTSIPDEEENQNTEDDAVETGENKETQEDQEEGERAVPTDSEESDDEANTDTQEGDDKDETDTEEGEKER